MRGTRKKGRSIFLALGLTLALVPRARAAQEWITVPVILGDYYAWAYVQAIEDRADIYGWSTAGVDALGWAITLAAPDYEGRMSGLFFVNLAGIAKTLYPIPTLLWSKDGPTQERAWIALGTHAATLLTLEFLGKPALSVQSMGPRGDAWGPRLAYNF